MVKAFYNGIRTNTIVNKTKTKIKTKTRTKIKTRIKTKTRIKKTLSSIRRTD